MYLNENIILIMKAFTYIVFFHPKFRILQNLQKWTNIIWTTVVNIESQTYFFSVTENIYSGIEGIVKLSFSVT